MTDAHQTCITDEVRHFEEHHQVSIDAMEWPDHACPLFKPMTCKTHGRGIWMHPTMGQMLAWMVHHEPSGTP